LLAIFALLNDTIKIFVCCLLISCLFITCSKEIEVDLPEVVSKIVVEGQIQQDQPPFILLTRTQGYFEPTDLTALEELFVRDAVVTVSNGSNTVELVEICSSDIPEDLLPLVTEVSGFSVEELQAFDLCAYTTFDETMYGEIGKVYDLKIEAEGEVLTASTKINELVELDDSWFQLSGDNDSLGFVFAVLTDPDTSGNAYRWFAKRINTYPSWSANAGEQKDQNYIAPLGSVYDDEFFNGLSFEFAYYRGLLPNSDKEDDNNEERGFFKEGDTVAVRGCVIDRGAYQFFVTFENQAGGQGSPFTVPANPASNINGGLGVWVGYGAVYDTIICVP
jgi:hypothetical protein